MLGKTNDYGVDGELRGITAEQASSAELHGLDFLKKVVRFPGVRINRDEFLRQDFFQSLEGFGNQFKGMFHSREK